MANKSPLVLNAGAVEQLQSGDGIIAAAFASPGAVVLSPGGTGGVQLGTGGNARGARAVDLQSLRAASSQVASGDYSCLSGGYSNEVASPQSAVIGGRNNVIDSGTMATAIIASAICSTTQVTYDCYYDAVIAGAQCVVNNGRYCAIIGANNCVISPMSTVAQCSVIIGCYRCTVTGNYSAVIAGNESSIVSARYAFARGYGAVANKHGQGVVSCGYFATAGDAQVSSLIAMKQTTTATPAELFLDGSSARLEVPEGATYGFTVKVVARQTNDDYSVARYVFDGVSTRNAGGNISVQVTKTYEYEDDSDWGCAVDADTANQTIRITVTGKADNNINWVARIETEETFA